jgi:hypothetical protein
MPTGLTPAQRRHRAYISSPEWARRRAAFRYAAGGRCVVCGSSAVDVHHLSYDQAYTGQEPDSDLTLLCRPHHDLAHAYHRSGSFPSLRWATVAMVAECRADMQVHRRARRRARLVVWAICALAAVLWLVLIVNWGRVYG